MSDISIQDPKKRKQREDCIAAALTKYGPAPEDKTILWADPNSALLLAETYQEMVGLRNIDGLVVPRLGVLSLILQATPCYVYNHPSLNKLCKTAFTDGVHIFVNEDFLNKLAADVRDSRGTEFGIEPLLMHEAMHKMLNHIERLLSFGPKIANAAADLLINTKLVAGYPEIKWCRTLRETGLGFKPGDLEKYGPMSEEGIGRELMMEELKKLRQQEKEKDKNNKNKKPGQQGGGGEGGGQGDPSQDDQQEPDQQAGSDFNGEDDNHLITLKDLIEALEEGGLHEAKDMLNLPDSSDVEEIGRVMEETTQRQHECIQKAMIDAANSNGKYPGKEIIDAAAEYLNNFTKGKLQWKLALREAVFGNGKKSRSSFEHISDIANVKSVTKMLRNRLILPTMLPHKSDECVIIIFDTSGSVSDEDLKSFVSECIELKTASEHGGDSASEVYIFCADTSVRADPILINDDNIEEILSKGMKVFGRTGTNLGGSLREVMGTDLMKEKRPHAVVFFTDLWDTPPTEADLNLEEYGENINLLFVCPQSTHSTQQESFARAVEPFARVVCIREGSEIDLDETKEMKVSPSMR